MSTKNSKKFDFDCWVNAKNFLTLFLHIMTRLYLMVQIKALKDFTCGWIIKSVDKKKNKKSQIFGDITIKASPPICLYISTLISLILHGRSDHTRLVQQKIHQKTCFFLIKLDQATVFCCWWTFWSKFCIFFCKSLIKSRTLVSWPMVFLS